MAFEDLELQVSPLTKQIYLGTLSMDRKKFVGKKKDVTSDVIGAIIKKVGVGNSLSIGVEGVEKYRILIMEVEPAKKVAPAAKKTKVTIKTLADGMQSSTTPRVGPLLKLTPALAKICGKGPMYRSEIVRKLWDYIKKKKLQDNVNKRLINCDDNLKVIFGKSVVSMFEIDSLIRGNVIRVE